MELIVKSMLKSIKEHESTLSMIFGVLVVLFVVGYIFVISPIPRSQITNELSSTTSADLQLTETSQVLTTKIDTHLVEEGDNLWLLAQTYYNDGYAWIKIAQANNLDNADLIEKGERLIIPSINTKVVPGEVAGDIDTDEPSNQDSQDILQETNQTSISKPIKSYDHKEPENYNTYIVKAGDTLWDIATIHLSNGFRWTEIFQANRQLINYPEIIEPGWVLSLPSS